MTSRNRNDVHTSRLQERTFAYIASVPGVEFNCDSCEEIVPHVFAISFSYTDPRPSRNGLVSDSFVGHVIIGKRGGAKGCIYCLDGCGIEYKFHTANQFWAAARCVARRHRFMA